MKKLLGITLVASLGLTGCAASAEDAISTFETNFESAETVTFSYQSAGDDYTFKTGDSLKFADTETLSFLNSANENSDKTLSYDEVYAVAEDEVTGIADDMDTYQNHTSKSTEGTTITFKTEGLSEDAGGVQTYTYSEDGTKLTIAEEFTSASGAETNTIFTIELA